MDTDALEAALKAHPEAKLLYTIPSFQNPSGITTTLEKRKKVYELACKYDIAILEDNPYGELRFPARTCRPSSRWTPKAASCMQAAFPR